MGKKLLNTFFKQFLYHLLNIAISIFILPPLWILFEKAQTVYSCITCLIYIITMYSIGWNCGNRDARNIPGYHPDKKFPFIAAGLGLVIPIALLVMRYALPDIWQADLPFITGETDFLFDGNALRGTTDFILHMWYFPMEAFITSGSAVAFAAVMLVQPIAIIAGYHVGLKRYRITEALLGKMVYEKRKKAETKK